MDTYGIPITTADTRRQKKGLDECNGKENDDLFTVQSPPFKQHRNVPLSNEIH
jgi:hypothetical protein